MKIEWKSCFRIGITLLLLILCVMALPQVGKTVIMIFSAAVPLIIGCVIAYLVNILMTMYEKVYFPKSRRRSVIKSRRAISVLLAFLTLVIVVVLIVALVLPQLVSCVALIVEKIPGTIKSIVAMLDNWNILTEDVVNYLTAIDWQAKISQLIDVISSGIGNMFDVVIGTITSVFSGLVTTLIAVIFSIYLLFGKERLIGQYRRLMARYVSPKLIKKVNHILSTMNDCFRRYIIGQCTEAVILGVLCTVGMWLLKLPYAAMIGALVAFTALIPVAGAYIGAFVGAFMILTVAPIKALVFLIFIVILQQLEGNIVYPRVVGTSVGLPGLWVLAAVTIGGGIAGVTGMLVGVPLAATAYRLIREDVYRDEPAEINKETEEKH